MPFIQRVVQPVNVAQVSAASATPNRKKAATRFQCMPGKCKNNNCINKQQQQQQQQQQHVGNEPSSRPSGEAVKDNNSQGTAAAAAAVTASATPTTNTTIKALVHSPQQQRHLNGFNDEIEHSRSNGFACTSFSYNTDTEDDLLVTSSAAGASAVFFSTSTSTTTASTTTMPTMKKLKQHVEFLSTSPTHTRSLTITATQSQMQSQSLPNSRQPSQQRQQQSRSVLSAPQSPTAARIVSGYEFDSISNITLSNALRQLASLVLIASDIFDELQRELQQVGERAGRVQRKITAVERRVCAYDPKMVTVPESDLLTFAQRKIHYETEHAFQKELFTADTRPHSVRQLYEDAGKVTPPTSASRARSPASPALSDDTLLLNDDGLLLEDTANTTGALAVGCDELVCTPVFGKANRKMRTRIDAEIEIRLPAAIEDLRKWTSSEALGDVTVTPDCMHHVDTSISTSVVIGDNGVLTPALSPSVLSADAVDALYAINVSNALDNTQLLPNDVNKDVPLNHRLPSPEEQTKIIALKYPAEVISVDTSGKRFQRMCAARKSTTGCYLSTPNNSEAGAGDANNLNEDVQTVSRRSRSRKVRGKRRNTIAGTDQKEIQDAANGETTTSGENKTTTITTTTTGTGVITVSTAAAAAAAGGDETCRREKSKKFGRSKSSDILKKETVALPYDKGKSTLTRLNSLKQWGRNRFKFMQRNDLTAGDAGHSHDTTSTSGCSSHNTSMDKTEAANSAGSSNSNAGSVGASNKKQAKAQLATMVAAAAKSADIDDECVVHELIQQKSEGRFSHERKPSYSSSEKSMSVSSSGHLRGKLQLAAGSMVVTVAACGNVKMRDTATLNRQRRNGLTANGLAGKDEQPHSSSGNWSASSESGRASIGSEITIQPKSSASNTSLNVSSFHPGSGPPSSMLSRRRFLNTSTSSSVTSEGTATPELQVAEGSYPNHLDDETSSAYSCDTEGYYTSFHMDSGLRTLKEEEPPMTPLQLSQQLHTSNYSFGSQSNQTVLNAENEYELFGRGSTSTTTSSAGTVCTTLMNGHGPDVPERISSLGKLNKSSHSNSASSSTLERSYSSSTIGSTLERTGTIKRNVNAAALKLATEPGNVDELPPHAAGTPESQEDEDDFSYEQRMRKRTALPLPPLAVATAASHSAEVECSESSDLEGVERIERIKQKTAINAKRIPSMCIITPTTSDDENQCKDEAGESAAYDPNRTLTNFESSPGSQAAAQADAALQHASNGCCVAVTVPMESAGAATHSKDHNLNVLKPQPPLGTPTKSLFGKLKVVLPQIKRSPGKSSAQAKPAAASAVNNDDLYDTAGEYVTIADISNNNRHNQLQAPKAVGASGLGIYYSNDIIRRRRHDNEHLRKADEPLTTAAAAAAAAAGAGAGAIKNQQQPMTQQQGCKEAAYVSLNELPQHLRRQRHDNAGTDDVACMGVAAAAVGGGIGLCAGSRGGGGGGGGVATANASESHAQSDACAVGVQSTSSAQYHNRRQRAVESSSVPMYAEISEIREEKSLSSPSVMAQQRGARVLRPNAEGRIVYDSDSLKRRKGAHTTFAPGPYVKETESALSSNAGDLVDAASSHERTAEANGATATAASESAKGPAASAASAASGLTKSAKLLFLNGGIASNRKIANVRPIVAKSPLIRAQFAGTRTDANSTASNSTLSNNNNHNNNSNNNNNNNNNRNNNNCNNNNNNNNSSSMSAYFEQTAATAAATAAAAAAPTKNTMQYGKKYVQQQEHKNLLANQTNPFYQPVAAATTTTTAPAAPMMPSPSTKSNSSTGSTATNSSTTSSAATRTSSSSSASSASSTTASAASAEEGYQRFSNIYEQIEQQPRAATDASKSTDAAPCQPFQRNAPIYWTLQNRRQNKPAAVSTVTCRDDLYATPIRRSERVARAAAGNGGADAATHGSNGVQSNISPIVPRNRSVFHTSTPTRGDSTENIPAKQPSSIRNWDDNSPERLNTCSDRIGHSKTSLLDFKKLLLAKSTKASPVPRKVSAVELLKKANAGANAVGTAATAGANVTAANMKQTAGGGSQPTAAPTINSSLKLLDLSGSPKTFANRRMLRQGQFGSPSKSFAPKLRANVVAAAQRTDVMSTTIPEANSSEEDHSNTSGSNSSRASSVIEELTQARSIAETSYDLKRNFFLQTEKNNFMRGELKPNFVKGCSPATSPKPNGKYVSNGVQHHVAANPTPAAVVRPTPAAVPIPALETAL